MNTRPKRYRRFPCEFTEVQIKRIHEYAELADTSYAEMARRLLDHGFTCPFFNPHVSPKRNGQPTETSE